MIRSPVQPGLHLFQLQRGTCRCRNQTHPSAHNLQNHIGQELQENQPDPFLSIPEKSTSDAQTQTEGPTTTLGSKPRKQGGNSATPLRNSVRCCTIS